ncbi:MAG: hypothetical protein KJO32_06425 [Deltaproteobacteria bacterium]|nr:hypothetical protein [Deltaproteobacteria bacterium]
MLRLPANNTLSESIRTYGILRPLIVIKQRDTVFELLCGRQRYQVWKNDLHKDRIVCHVLQPPLQTISLLRLIFEDQRLSGLLSAVEKAQFSALCQELLTPEELSKLFELLKLGNLGYLQRITRLLTLERPILDALHAGRLSEKVGFELITMSAEDRFQLYTLFDKLSLNNNKQRRLISYMRTLCSREKSTMSDYLQKNYGELTRAAAIENAPQAGLNLLNDLQKRCMPMSSRAEKEFQDQVSQLKLPTTCSVEHSPAFEKDAVTLSISFENLADLTQKAPILLKHIR